MEDYEIIFPDLPMDSLEPYHKFKVIIVDNLDTLSESFISTREYDVVLGEKILSEVKELVEDKEFYSKLFSKFLISCFDLNETMKYIEIKKELAIIISDLLLSWRSRIEEALKLAGIDPSIYPNITHQVKIGLEEYEYFLNSSYYYWINTCDVYDSSIYRDDFLTSKIGIVYKEIENGES